MFRNGKAFKLTSILFIILFCLSACSPEEPGLDDPDYYYSDAMGNRHLTDGDKAQTPGFYSHWLYLVAEGKCYIARVSFVKMKRHDEASRRAEYVFKVIEYLIDPVPGLKPGKEISTYSSAYPLKYKSTIELREINYGYTYEADKEYVIIISPTGYLNDAYIPLNNIANISEKPLMEDYGIKEGMSPDEVVAKIKELIAEEKAN